MRYPVKRVCTKMYPTSWDIIMMKKSGVPHMSFHCNTQSPQHFKKNLFIDCQTWWCKLMKHNNMIFNTDLLCSEFAIIFFWPQHRLSATFTIFLSNICLHQFKNRFRTRFLNFETKYDVKSLFNSLRNCY